MSKLDKAMNSLDNATLKELEAMSPDDLKKRIVQASSAMDTVARELDENPKYQRIKSDKSAMEQGKREVNKRQNAIICVALHQLEEKGVELMDPAVADFDEEAEESAEA